ncbi:MAG: cation diffusion facilitator family transporter [Halanaerobiales bacterium]|nr:cation diffusion facilitator family transporter [Halanaerobiales bacterium]
MGHNHDEVKGKNLVITIALNFIITIVEVIGGVLSGSLSLISDALHNFSDGISVVISYFALRMAKKENTTKMTFGYKRAEIIAALFNAAVLVIISVFLFKEAYLRLVNPEPIKGLTMILVALVGLTANTISVFLLKKGAKDSVNIKSAYIHLLSDAFSSIGVVIGGLMIYFYDVYWIDPLLTIIIGVYIMIESIKIIIDTVKILMEAVPDDIDVQEIKDEVTNLNYISDIHHLHFWQVSDNDLHLECHINLNQDLKLTKTKEIREEVIDILNNKFGINHVTMQLEYDCCPQVGLIKQR